MKTVGSSSNPDKIDLLFADGRRLLSALQGQQSLAFNQLNEEQLVNLFFEGIRKLTLVGPDLLLGKLFDEIGFGTIPDELFRHLVLTRLCYQ